MSDSSNPPPGEEPAAPPAAQREVIRVATASLRVPRGLETREATGSADRVVAVIALLALAFVALIAWLIHGGQ